MNRQDAKRAEPTAEHDRIARQIVDSAFAVHSALGPGLLESVYEECLAFELKARGRAFARQIPIPIVYRDVRIDAGFRVDLMVDRLVIAEIKAVERILPVHEAQLLTYLKLTGCGVGLLINFNVPRIKDGIRRMVMS